MKNLKVTNAKAAAPKDAPLIQNRNGEHAASYHDAARCQRTILSMRDNCRDTSLLRPLGRKFEFAGAASWRPTQHKSKNIEHS